MRARDYDPKSGRFSANDPVEVPMGMPYVAGYSYAFNNPLSGTDASGNWSSNCGAFSQLCDSYSFFANEIIGAAKGVVGIGSAIANPIGTYNGLVGSCNAGFAQYGGNGPSFEGFLQCVDNLNPIAAIRNQFTASNSATNVEDSGQAFGQGLLGVGLTAAPFVKGILRAPADCGTMVEGVPAAETGDNLVRALPRGGATLTQGSLDHIVYRHWSTSGFSGVGKFAEGTSVRSLTSMVDDVARNGTIRPNTGGRPGTIFEQDLGQTIGMNGAGKATSRLRVVVAPDGTVVTAFPY
jgi:hypothetical protein